MVVGTLQIRLLLPENQSLKDKRQIVRSIIERVRARFDVAIAEVDDLDRWQSAVLGVAAVSNDVRHANEVLSHVVAFVERFEGDVQLADYSIEVLHVT